MTVTTAVGIYIKFSGGNLLVTPIESLVTVNYMMYLVSKYLTMIFLTSGLKKLSMLFSLTTHLHRFVSTKFLKSGKDFVFKTLYCVTTFFYLTLFFHDIRGNTFPTSAILKLVWDSRKDYALVIQPFVLLFCFPSATIFYAVYFNYSIMLILDSELHETIVENIIATPSFDVSRVVNVLPIVEEVVFTVSGRRTLLPSQDNQLSSREKLIQINRALLETKTFLRVSNEIYANLMSWIILFVTTSMPVYVTVMVFKLINHSRPIWLFILVELTLTAFNVLPVVKSTLNRCRKQYLTVVVVKQVFCKSDVGRRKVLRNVSNNLNNCYLDSQSLFFDFDSSFLSMELDFAMLLLTSVLG